MCAHTHSHTGRDTLASDGLGVYTWAFTKGVVVCIWCTESMPVHVWLVVKVCVWSLFVCVYNVIMSCFGLCTTVCPCVWACVCVCVW